MTGANALSASEERTLVAVLTADTLSAVAPEEIPSFEADRGLYLDGGRPEQKGGVDQQLGFGLEVAVLLTPVVVAAARAVVGILADALADSAVKETKATVAAWIHRILHRDAPGSPAPLFTARELTVIRKTAYDVCRNMHAEDSDAQLVADALTGRLAAVACAVGPT